MFYGFEKLFLLFKSSIKWFSRAKYVYNSISKAKSTQSNEFQLYSWGISMLFNWCIHKEREEKYKVKKIICI
jgi:hypothetical protein